MNTDNQANKNQEKTPQNQDNSPRRNDRNSNQRRRPARKPYNKSGNRDNRENRDSSDKRENKDKRDYRDNRDNRDNRAKRDSNQKTTRVPESKPVKKSTNIKITRPPEGNENWQKGLKTTLLWVVILMSVFFFAQVLKTDTEHVQKVGFTEYRTLLQAGKIESAVIKKNQFHG